jgi:signal transduction histidine kinase
MQKQANMLLNNAPRRHLPLSLIAAALIILIAAGAIFYLRALTSLYEKASRSSAAKSVIDQGTYISQWLADHPFFQQAQNEKEDAANFNRTVDWLQKMENGVQYVSISEDDVVLYQRQIGAGKTEIGLGKPAPARQGQMAIGRKKLVLGTNILPVITFSMAQTTPAGHQRMLEVALNKAIIERQSAVSISALNRMYYISLVTIVIAFMVCLAAIVGFVHREMVWQKRSRLDEHLAFAGAVAGSVIHDFRNPLSAMRLDAQLLQGETAKDGEARPERLAELAQRIVKTIDRIDGLLAEFLTMAKPEGNERETFDVNVCVQDCIELLKMRFEKAGVNLAIDLAKERLRVLGFPAQFKRALLNIMTNAEQFSPPTGKVTIQTRIEKKYVLIKIMDEGPGIPYPERKKIFDLFYSNRPGGTGIGLALAKTAIENCGGDIECQTPPDGKGALFIIRIPMMAV